MDPMERAVREPIPKDSPKDEGPEFIMRRVNPQTADGGSWHILRRIGQGESSEYPFYRDFASFVHGPEAWATLDRLLENPPPAV